LSHYTVCLSTTNYHKTTAARRRCSPSASSGSLLGGCPRGRSTRTPPRCRSIAARASRGSARCSRRVQACLLASGSRWRSPLRAPPSEGSRARHSFRSSVSGVSVGTSDITGSNWNYSLGGVTANSCSLGGSTLTVAPNSPGGGGGSGGPSCGQVTITWNAVSGADGYYVYRNISNAFAGAAKITTKTPAGSGVQSYVDSPSGGFSRNFSRACKCIADISINIISVRTRNRIPSNSYLSARRTSAAPSPAWRIWRNS
jgi:hypothetical protein